VLDVDSLLLNSTNQQSLNKVIGTFLSAPTHSIPEFSISMFGKRYQDLPFVEVTAHDHESELYEE
jgi:hypothetical protein